jgi:hypothetical protein
MGRKAAEDDRLPGDGGRDAGSYKAAWSRLAHHVLAQQRRDSPTRPPRTVRVQGRSSKGSG